MLGQKSPLLAQRASRVPTPFVPASRTSMAAPSRLHQQRSAIVTASKLDDKPLISSSLLGGPIGMVGAGPSSSRPAAGPAGIDNVPLLSECGMDYTALRDALKAGDFRKADDETRALLIRLAGEGAIKRGWVYFTEIKSISTTDFQTMDGLWRAASMSKFGFSVQKELWIQNAKRWPKFFKQIDWVQGENNVYRKWPMEFVYTKDAVKGHLPLTNALRGTQLFQAILEHPAFDKNVQAQGKSLDDIAREQAAKSAKLF